MRLFATLLTPVIKWYYVTMPRLIIYGFLGIPIGLVLGFAVSGTLVGPVVGALIASSIGLAVAAFMNCNGILNRPFWNRQDVELFLSHPSAHDWILPKGYAEWMRSKIED